MASAQPSLQQPRSLAGIGMSLAVHALLIGVWQLSRPVQRQGDTEPQRVQFLRLLPAPAPERADNTPPSPARAASARRPAASSARSQPMPDSPAPETITLPPPQVAESPAPAAPSAADLLRDARAAAGAIDRALRDEQPRRGIHAPAETTQTKLAKGIAEAADMAPNRWYQAPKTQEIVDAGGYGRKRYRVVGAAGTYCITYESNRAPDGIDSMQRGLRPKVTSCPPHEGPATEQQWD
jgi:hypothetical protein